MNSGGKTGERSFAIVLVAIEPRAYAHAIGQVIEELRPSLDVRIVEPEDIDRQVRTLRPSLVLCSRPRISPANGKPRWVEYSPYARRPEAEIRIDGTMVATRGVSLMDLVEIVDQAHLQDAPENILC